jgi:transcription initiation factor TFIID subunit 7
LINLQQGFDRELDSDEDEPLYFEEQFILRMPGGGDEDWEKRGVEITEKLRRMVQDRSLGSKQQHKDDKGKGKAKDKEGEGNDREKGRERETPDEFWLKFKDQRRAVFGMGKDMWSAKLVDLPCIIESQKTLDGRHLYKIADISQVCISSGD